MYSDMSRRTSACSLSKRNSASARASSVFPTPVGPRKMNEPIGRFGSLMPARARSTALATAVTASSCPTTRLWRCSARWTSFSRSPSTSLETGIPVQRDTTSAMSSSSTRSLSSRRPPSALARAGVALLPERLALDLELHDLAVDLVQLLGLGVDLGAQAGGGFVHQVDRLVGEEAVGDVAVREGRGRNQRGVLDLDAVVHLVALLQPAQDRDGVLDRGLVDQHGLEAALEGRVLLDVLAVLVQRGRADAVQLAAGEHGLQQVGGVHRPLGRARADHRMQLVDEEDDVAARALDLLQDGLQALLELAAELGAGDQCAHVERDDPLLLESLGHVALDDALREALDDRRLADTGLADQHRVVLGAAGEDLDDAPDLVVAPDDRVELPLRGELGEVAAVLLERLVGGLGIGRGDALVAAHLLEGRHQPLAREAEAAEDAALGGHGEEEVLDAQVLVLEPPHLVLGLGEQLREALGDEGLRRPARGARDLRAARELALDRFLDRARRDAGRLEQVGREAVGLLEEGQQQVLDVDALVAPARGDAARALQRLLDLVGHAVHVHHRTPRCARGLAASRQDAAPTAQRMARDAAPAGPVRRRGAAVHTRSTRRSSRRTASSHSVRVISRRLAATPDWLCRRREERPQPPIWSAR